MLAVCLKVKEFMMELFLNLRNILERFFFTLQRMGFNIPYTENQINEASKKIISIQKVNNGYVRPVAWRGTEMMAISAQQTKIHDVAIATWE